MFILMSKFLILVKMHQVSRWWNKFQVSLVKFIHFMDSKDRGSFDLIFASSLCLVDESVQFCSFFCRITWVQLFSQAFALMNHLMCRKPCSMVDVCGRNIHEQWIRIVTKGCHGTFVSHDFASKWCIHPSHTNHIKTLVYIIFNQYVVYDCKNMLLDAISWRCEHQTLAIDEFDSGTKRKNAIGNDQDSQYQMIFGFQYQHNR